MLLHEYNKDVDLPAHLHILIGNSVIHSLDILGECLLISSLPGKALRMLVDIARLAEILRILGECLLISSLPGKA